MKIFIRWEDGQYLTFHGPDEESRYKGRECDVPEAVVAEWTRIQSLYDEMQTQMIDAESEATKKEYPKTK